MIIISKSKDTIINMDHVTKIYVGGNTEAIRAEISNGGSSEIAKYTKRDVALYALEMLSLAAAGGESYFYMPSDQEIMNRMQLERSGQGHVHVKTKATLHGGS